MNDAKLRRSAEELFAEELAALKRGDDRPRPENWLLSPQAVVTYVLGGTAKDGTAISAKYVGNRRLIETAVATLATDRALLLLGLPGTAKSWVSEHLAAAVSGSSQRLIQCTAGTDENQIRYGWNYAMLLAGGPSMAALVKTPLTRAMEEGTILRLEELTRMGSDTQDTLITVLSEKTLPIPELDTSIEARRGTGLKLPPIKAPDQELARIVTLFRELRDGKTLNGKTQLKTSSGSLSTAEAISVGVSAWAEAAHFGQGTVEAAHMAANVVGAVVKDPVQDLVVLQEYLENVVRSRDGWDDLYRAIREVI